MTPTHQEKLSILKEELQMVITRGEKSGHRHDQALGIIASALLMLLEEK